MKIDQVEGIGPAYAEKLARVGVKTTADLLKAGKTSKSRNELAEKTSISVKLILEWVNHADLFRINGVGGEYADLLEEAGVDTVPELAQRKATNLYEKMVEVNAKKKLVRRIPPLVTVENWVKQAKDLPREIEY